MFTHKRTTTPKKTRKSTLVGFALNQSLVRANPGQASEGRPSVVVPLVDGGSAQQGGKHG